MAQFKVRTRDKTDPKGKPRVYFTCHFDDFERYFDKICSDIFTTHDVAIYYTPNMSEPFDEENMAIDLGQMNLFAVPVSLRLLTEPNRAMQTDIAFAKELNIPILPFMMDSGIDVLYSRPENFGQRQYLSPLSADSTEMRYEDKLKKHLEAVLISDEMARRVRAAFDAYIFLSYRKKDRRFANDLMRIIHNIPECRDIAVWYDEFLTPGESFAENIRQAMDNSRLFAMIVTPSLLEQGNYVMTEEYPLAREKGMDILPTEMAKTDFSELSRSFEGITRPVRTEDICFKESLLRTLVGLAKRENDGDTEHNFLIGLAYLDGIDVEVDSVRGISLISAAAEGGLPEAMEYLFHLYFEGNRVAQDYDKAAKLATRIYDFYTKTYGEEHEKVAEWLNLLGLTYSESTQYDKAVEYQKKAYNLYLKLYGKNHPSSITALENLSVTYGYLGDFYRAVGMQAKAYARNAELLGDNHPSTIRAMNHLGQLYVKEGKDAESAFDFTEGAYYLRCEVLGEEHPHSLESLNNLAMAYHIFGNPTKAAEHGERLCEIAERTLGEDNSRTLLYMSNLAVVYQKLNNIKRMTEILEKVCDRWQRSGQGNHPHALLATYNLVNAYYGSLKLKRAYELCDSLYTRQLKIFGADHPETKSYLTLLRSLCISRFNFKRWAELSGALDGIK